MDAMTVIQFDMRRSPDSQEARYQACPQMVRWGDRNGIAVAGLCGVTGQLSCRSAGLGKVLFPDPRTSRQPGRRKAVYQSCSPVWGHAPGLQAGH